MLTVSLCFGLGLGFAPALRSAHACSCADAGAWALELEQVTGDGDPILEAAQWSAAARLSGTRDAVLQVSGTLIELERVQ